MVARLPEGKEETMSEPVVPVDAEFTLLKRHLTSVKRRAAVRYRSNLATLGQLFFPDSGETWEAWVHNLSESGIGLNLSRPLTMGGKIVIRLKGTPDYIMLQLPARVIHATQEVDGTWRVGCEFEQKLNADELETLL
jgi:hypothetical protein